MSQQALYSTNVAKPSIGVIGAIWQGLKLSVVEKLYNFGEFTK